MGASVPQKVGDKRRGKEGIGKLASAEAGTDSRSGLTMGQGDASSSSSSSGVKKGKKKKKGAGAVLEQPTNLTTSQSTINESSIFSANAPSVPMSGRKNKIEDRSDTLHRQESEDMYNGGSMGGMGPPSSQPDVDFVLYLEQTGSMIALAKLMDALDYGGSEGVYTDEIDTELQELGRQCLREEQQHRRQHRNVGVGGH